MKNNATRNLEWRYNQTKSQQMDPDNNTLITVDIHDTESEFISLVVLLSIFSAGGTAGNALVLYVFSRRKDEIISNFFIMTLAFVDFITCLVIIPMSLYMEYVQFYINSPVLCKLYHFLITSNIPFSALVMVVIAVDRYLSICWPLVRWFSVTRARIIITLLAALSASIGICVALMYSIQLEGSPEYANNANNYSRRISGLSLQSAEEDFNSSDSISGINKLDKEFNTSALYNHLKLDFENVTQIYDDVPDDRPLYLDKYLCWMTDSILSVEFALMYQKVYTAVFIVCFFIVLILYLLIYHSVLVRRARRRRQRCTSLSMQRMTSRSAFITSQGSKKQRPGKEENADNSPNPNKTEAPVENTTAFNNRDTEYQIDNNKSDACLRFEVRRDSIMKNVLLDTPEAQIRTRSAGKINKDLNLFQTNSGDVRTHNMQNEQKNLVEKRSQFDTKGNEIQIDLSRIEQASVGLETGYNTHNETVAKVDCISLPSVSLTYARTQQTNDSCPMSVRNNKSVTISKYQDPAETRSSGDKCFLESQSSSSLSRRFDENLQKFLHCGVARTDTVCSTDHNSDTYYVFVQSANEFRERLDTEARSDIVSSERERAKAAVAVRPAKRFTSGDKIMKRDRIANLKTAAMLFVVTLVYIITYLPAHLMALQLISHNRIIFYFYFANNVANPIIYSFMNNNFRNSLLRLFCYKRSQK